MQKKVKVMAGITALILIIVAVFMINKEAGNKDIEYQSASINTEIPFNEGTSTKSKLDAYQKEIEDNNNNNRNNSLDDFGDINVKGLEKKEELTPDEKVDSILNANKIIYDKPLKEKTNTNKRKKNHSSSDQKYNNAISSNNNTTEKEKPNYNTNNKSNLNNFFKSNPKGEKNKQNVAYDKTIYAVVYGDKNTPNGGRVALRLSKDALINGVKYARNTILYSFAKFGQNRVYLHVSKINQNNVSLDVYDTQDGSKGIYTEKNLINEEVTESAGNLEIKGIPVERLGKDLLKKTKNKKVMIFNNYKILLKKSK